MTLEAIVYVSSAVGSPSEPELEALLEKARSKNREVSVTGVLLHHEGSFFQYFEGPPQGVQDVYDRILASPMHHGIIELMRTSIHERAFSDWQMAFTGAPKSVLLRFSKASWFAEMRGGSSASPVSDGAALLLDFWNTNAGRQAA